MKRYGYLYDKVCDRDNLAAAELIAREGKGRKAPVRRFLARREELLDRLHADLVAGTYRPQPCPTRTIHEPKERVITIPRYYPNLIVDHAVVRVVGDIWRRSLPHNVYSNVPGRGVEACRKAVRAIIDRHKDAPRLYCLKTDIAKFYPSLRHDVLKAVVRHKIKDTRLLALLDRIIDSGGEEGSGVGLPIGNHLSQHLANLIIGGLVHRINASGLECACYADDVVVLSPDKAALWRCLNEVIRPCVEGTLCLSLKDTWQVFPLAAGRHDRNGRGLDFVGYVFFRACTALRGRIKRSLIRAAKAAARKGLGDKDYSMALAPWLGWLQHSDCQTLARTHLKNHTYERYIYYRAHRAAA